MPSSWNKNKVWQFLTNGSIQQYCVEIVVMFRFNDQLHALSSDRQPSPGHQLAYVERRGFVYQQRTPSTFQLCICSGLSLR